MKRISLTLIFLSFGLTSCALQRSRESGYHENNYDYGAKTDSRNLYRERAEFQQQLAMKELGIYNAQALSDTEESQVRYRVELNKLERRLVSRREKSQYYRAKPFLRSDAERVAFLRISSPEARERWLRNRGVSISDEAAAAPYQKIIEENDLALNMPRQAVRESWGEPDAVEVAGDPIYGNERWVYSKDVTNSEGYTREKRIIYFESGRVVGWETN